MTTLTEGPAMTADYDSQPDTEAAPTEQASAETTELPPADHAAADVVHAWSVDTEELDAESPRAGCR